MSRISIEKVEDWKRIRDNFTKAMLDILDEKLAQSSSQHVRDAVTVHLLQWRDRTFDAAQENIRVNGHNLEEYSEEQEETEPYDEALDCRVWSLSTERMTWDNELAMRRRTTPAEVQHLVEDLLARQRAAEQALPSIQDDIELDADDAKLERETDVADTFNQVMSLVDDLRTSAPQILERTERAHEIAEEIKCLPT